MCFMDRTAFVLHPNASHREDGATHTTTTSFDMRFAARASLLTVCLLRMTRTAPHCHAHSHSALLVYPRAHRSPARVQHIAHVDADTLTQSRANNIVTVSTTKCRIKSSRHTHASARSLPFLQIMSRAPTPLEKVEVEIEKVNQQITDLEANISVDETIMNPFWRDKIDCGRLRNRVGPLCY